MKTLDFEIRLNERGYVVVEPGELETGRNTDLAERIHAIARAFFVVAATAMLVIEILG